MKREKISLYIQGQKTAKKQASFPNVRRIFTFYVRADLARGCCTDCRGYCTDFVEVSVVSWYSAFFEVRVKR